MGSGKDPDQEPCMDDGLRMTRPMVRPRGRATPLADGLWLLDTLHQGEPGVVGCYLLVGHDGLALVDVGPERTHETLLAGVRRAGFDPAQIEHLILTHVHLDHAGAAGRLARVLPNARVYVHGLGAPHLIDPSKLVASATRIYGERMATLWGTILPVPRERLVILDDGAELAVGGRTLRVIYTPGHAVHHVALYDAVSGDLFAGDVAGVRHQGVAYVRPPTPPPDLHLEDWYASLRRVADLDPKRLYLAHFGPVDDVRAHLAELAGRLASWGAVTLAGVRANKTVEQVAADLEAASRDDLLQAAAGQRD
jgi:glyoxylase-like metal-dependent hydrolase (beta-lactamase superfamily II)